MQLKSVELLCGAYMDKTKQIAKALETLVVPPCPHYQPHEHKPC
jgi:hypothetical protein